MMQMVYFEKDKAIINLAEVNRVSALYNVELTDKRIMRECACIHFINKEVIILSSYTVADVLKELQS